MQRQHAAWSRCFSMLLVAIVLPGVPAAFAQERSPSVLVRRVIDGDTIDMALIGRVQLLGVDAPELSARVKAPDPGARVNTATPFAREAQQRLEGLLANRWVRLEYEGGSSDSRRSVYVFLEDGRFVNEWLVREGLARVSARQQLRRLAELQRAEVAARASRRGIWRDRSPVP